jgi:hypothetical protein
MKLFIMICMFVCASPLTLAAASYTAVYDAAVLTEDVAWRGSILVRGAVVVAPQATLRIEPGTVVRFTTGSAGTLPNLVVQGRIQAAGTVEQPIVLTSDQAKPYRGAWGGVVLLATEKRNLLERCRIEYAETGIDVRFSAITLKAVSIAQTLTALSAHDGVVQIVGGAVADADTGLDIHTSEFDGKDLSITSCQRGGLFDKSAVVLASSKITNNKQIGLEAQESRIKFTAVEFSENALGARITGGEGQIAMSRFVKNGQTALHLSGARLKIQRSQFATNTLDAIRTEDGSALLLNNSFSANGGFNLYNAGRETVTARQNWWGTSDQLQIGQKIHDSADDKNSGAVLVFPWLNEKPLLTP